MRSSWVRRGSKRQLTGVFLRAIYLNRVKSGGSCQAVSGALLCRFPAVLGKKGVEGFNRMMKMSISGMSEDWNVAKAGLYPANVLILIFLLANWLSRRSNRMLNLKGLVAT